MNKVRSAGLGRQVLALAISATLYGGLAAAAPPGPPAKPPVLLRLEHDAFDPVQRMPAVPAALDTAADAGPTAVHLVQFHGPIDAAAHALLQRSGLTLLGYVPDFAFLVRGEDARVQALAGDAQVRWTGPWPPAFRLHPSLLARIQRAEPGHRQLVEVVLFPDMPAASLDAYLALHAVSVSDVGPVNDARRAMRLEVPDTMLAALAQRPEVAWIEPHVPVRRANALSRGIVGKDRIETVFGLYGAGQMVGVGDDGLSTGNVDTLHPDFEGRLAGATSTEGEVWGFGLGSEHGTHVAGTVLGSGALDGSDPAQQLYTGTHAGVAPEALLYAWALCPCDAFLNVPPDLYGGYLQPQYDFDPRLRISNNSWGNDFNGYGAYAAEMDAFVHDHPDMILVVAAGNDGDAAHTVGSPATAKNALTVGSIENDPSADPVYTMSDFSSRGPVQDGRLKPDVVAPGRSVWSTVSTLPDTHAYMPQVGTSMAAPAVSGAAAIVRQFFQEREALAAPSAALVKAMLISGAQDVDGGALRQPDMAQGWGRIDLRASLEYTEGRQLWYYEHPGLATGETFSATLSVQDTGWPIRATLVWSDARATGGAGVHLVNDLDLEVGGPADGGPIVYTGNDRLGDGLLDLDVDRLNNVEGVDADAPVAGDWTLNVTAWNVPHGPQPFALVATGGFGPWSALTLDVAPDSATVCAGSSADGLFDLQVRRQRSDLVAPVTLAVPGLPPGMAVAFSANGEPADFDSSLSLVLDRSVPGTDYTLTLQADAGPVGTLTEATLSVLPLPAMPALLQPGAGAVNVPRSPLLDWAAAAAADDGYQVQIARDPDFTDMVHEATMATPGLELPLILDLSSTYYWRVTALNGCGDTVSDVRSFTVVGEPIFADDFEGQ